MELKIDTDARLDKVYVSGMIVTDIVDLSTLITEGIAVVKIGLPNNKYLHTESGGIYSSITINKKDEVKKVEISLLIILVFINLILALTE